MDPESDQWVRSDEIRRRLRDLLEDVEHQGAHVYVLRYDKPAAVIVPVDWYEATKTAITEGNS